MERDRSALARVRKRPPAEVGPGCATAAAARDRRRELSERARRQAEMHNKQFNASSYKCTRSKPMRRLGNEAVRAQAGRARNV
ncbi:hypothetical protein EVAR_67938_1 [Eumeta japonica]|uniref:Uncharacterized protein n=1 Tax=Eumeta variegata TaxID=151549 RepID=A0A4C2A756_EUMVA|nr:hypothetical protein EVAR_67938_1 [Eumeta japonica]